MAVALFDASTRDAVVKAINATQLGITAQEDGESVLVHVPPATAETRKAMMKLVKAAEEGAKVNIRRARKDAMDLLKAAKLPQDESKKADKEVQTLTDKRVAEVLAICAAKEKELQSA